MGSSPLARGLLLDNVPSVEIQGIIPARAGFTPVEARVVGDLGDHPRSRGVYVGVPSTGAVSGGSSPLARGLLGEAGGVAELVGIIPARAGFTACATLMRQAARDHPRSRGVYRSISWSA